MKLNFPVGIPEEDLIGRVMGPDLHGARYYVQAVYNLTDKTTVDLRPLSPGETRIYRDEWMQEWVKF